ncbi:unnamed protein product [Rotaria sordida]|uniref:Uncharacterized protein n=1 Tax=Rotaria sordida TaxID=392033 RepID=A0A815GWZ4_9BILA|nr:unnamed protein product [Rotaria sordida]CAF4099875.1 unnamed protein product [Rotaria sordida]
MLSQHHRLMFIVFSEKKTVRFYSTKDNERFDRRTGYAFAWCFTSTNGFTKLGLVLAIICALFLVIAVSIIPCVIIVKYNTVQGTNWNLTAAINTFSQFDVIVFDDGIASSSHGDHANTQIIIQ